MYYDLEGMFNDDDDDDDIDFNLSDDFDDFKDSGLRLLELRFYCLFDEFDDEDDFSDWFKWKLNDFKDDLFCLIRGLWFLVDLVDLDVFENIVWYDDDFNDFWKGGWRVSYEGWWRLWLELKDENDISVEKRW